MDAGDFAGGTRGSREIADRVATDPCTAERDVRQRAIVDLTLALTRRPELFGERDVAAPRA